MNRKERHIAQSAAAEEEQRVTEEWTISDEMRRLEENIGMAVADAEGATEEEEKRRRTTRGWGPCGGGGCGGCGGECRGCGGGGGEATKAAAMTEAEAEADAAIEVAEVNPEAFFSRFHFFFLFRNPEASAENALRHDNSGEERCS
ncbi:hypothetical protein LR48_Vigan694s000400 [Vigna angularis]|uniref:Uncharacterized protein n=1 Tax=Phaseolus angularis TaxID=3914 RepID=A0A0L9TG97_PHAAN|nr:hypothetical protein LR48_Vigan694s000400 [Vigna angularis]